MSPRVQSSNPCLKEKHVQEEEKEEEEGEEESKKIMSRD